MEYDQRVIIKFLSNEGADARQIVTRLQGQFSEHFHRLRTVKFWIAISGAAVKTCMMKFAAYDLIWTILIPKFWRF
jgi:hypothetical protein